MSGVPPSDPGFEFALGMALQQVVHFHNYIRELLREKFADIGSDSTSRIPAEKFNELDKMHTVNCFLSAFAVPEESLFLAWKTRAPAAERGQKGDVLDRYAPVLAYMKVDYAHQTYWRELRDAEKVRHCLLHANGRINMMRERDAIFIQSFSSKYPDELVVKNNAHLEITPRFLRRIVEAIGVLQDALVHAQIV